MIEKINTIGYESISTPSKKVIYFLDNILESNKEPINVAEVGIGIGATSIEITRRLRNDDAYYFFSYEHDVIELEADLKNTYFCKCKLYPMGNTTTTYDSYNWKLSSLCLENEVLFDLVYLDGAHSLFHDGLATVLLKKLVKPGGILIFDDIFWTYKISPTLNPEVRPETSENYSKEQIEAEQMKLVIDLFMETDENWERIGDIEWQTAYRKIM